ncbi:RnfH family protein [Utexia brackfieldae]|uniref:RnfH family protein n=1 Tax=Utexia brackfieldae TaxID=3074108 RepID=UPI00370D5240
MIKLSVVYALPADITLLECQVAEGTTVLAAIKQSGFLTQCQLDISTLAVGVYGQRVELDDIAEAGDRIEIYRPLLGDPKEIRRRRAKEQQ